MALIPLSYNLRRLAVRRTTTAATAGGIALVVFVFASVNMLTEGIRDTLPKTGSSDIAIVMSKDGAARRLPPCGARGASPRARGAARLSMRCAAEMRRRRDPVARGPDDAT